MTARVRIGVGKDRYDLRCSYWWFRLRWRWALRHRRFFRCVCADGKPRWFNACQIAWAMEL